MLDRFVFDGYLGFAYFSDLQGLLGLCTVSEQCINVLRFGGFWCEI